MPRTHAACFREVIEPLLDDPSVEFVGEIGDGEKSAFLGNAKALLFPIDWPEPFGLVMIESLACGTPVVTRPYGSVPEACRAAMRGEPFLYAGVASTLVRDFLERMRRGERMPRSVLTAREEEVVKLIAEGHSSKEIASALVIALKTVERHRANVLQKLELRDRTQLTRYAIRTGLVEP